MNKPFFSLMLVSLLITASTFAGDVELAGKMDRDHTGRAGGKFHGGWCHLNLSDEQKASMKAESFKFKEARIDLEAELKHSRLDYVKLMSDPKADYKSAKAAADLVAKNMSRLIAQKQAFRTEIAFKIFNQDQRMEALKCHRGHRRGFGGKFQHRRPNSEFSADARVPGNNDESEDDGQSFNE
jgi:Spy/CpxP family protein refolding chaperone